MKAIKIVNELPPTTKSFETRFANELGYHLVVFEFCTTLTTTKFYSDFYGYSGEIIVTMRIIGVRNSVLDHPRS